MAPRLERIIRLLAIPVLGAAFLVSVMGCDAVSFRKPDFDTAETGEDGQVYVLDDLRDIAADTDLTIDEKRDAFRNLGIEDEDLIDALLQL